MGLTGGCCTKGHVVIIQMCWSVCGVLQLVETENVRGVITMNELYETKYFCNSAEVSLKHLANFLCVIESLKKSDGGLITAATSVCVCV